MLIMVTPLTLLCDPLSRPEEPPTWSGYMGKMFQAATNYLPAQVSGMMSQDRAFATVRLNISGQRNICALSTYVLTLLTSAPGPGQPYLVLLPAEHVVWVLLCLCVGVFWPQDAFPSRIQKLPRLLVTTSDGHLYIYNLDPQDGGECVLIKNHR